MPIDQIPIDLDSLEWRYTAVQPGGGDPQVLALIAETRRLRNLVGHPLFDLASSSTLLEVPC